MANNGTIQILYEGGGRVIKIIFVDNVFEEIETDRLNMTIEEVLKVLPSLDYRVGPDRIHYEKTGKVIVDLKEKTLEIQLDFP